MVCRTRTELEEAQKSRRQSAEREAWRHYVQGLAQIDDPLSAQRFADNGPHGVEPASRLYHNLGCFLHGTMPDRPSRTEYEEFLKFLRRAEAKGPIEPGSADSFQQKIDRALGRPSTP